jgi:integrase
MLGRRIGGSNQTVAEYLPRWLEEVARHRVRDTTYEVYEYLIRMYLVPEFGKFRLSRLQAADVRRGLHRLKVVCQCCAHGRDRARLEKAQALEQRRLGRKPRKNARPIRGARCCALTPPECCRAVLSDATVQAAHRLLRTALQDAVTDGLLAENVARSLRLVFPYRPRFQPWSAAEARLFLHASRDHRLGALYALGLMTGMRRGEVLGLAWVDVDSDRAVVRVRQALQRAGGGLRLGPVKTDGSIRFVALPQPCLQALQDHRRRQNLERAAAGDRWVETGLVFTTSTGSPLEPSNVNKAFAELSAAAGVRRIRFHDLRHSCATLLYELGVPIENIQDVLGHSTPVITKLLYVDGSEKVQRGAADRLGELFGA